MIYSDVVALDGLCRGAKTVFINSSPVELKDNRFQVRVRVGDYGKQAIFVTLYDELGNKTQQRIRLLYLKKFADLTNNKLSRLVEVLATLGYFPESYGVQFQPRQDLVEEDRTEANQSIWQKAWSLGIDRERFAILLFKDPKVKRSAANLLDWEKGYLEKLDIDYKPVQPAILVPEIKPKEAPVVKPVVVVKQEVPVAKSLAKTTLAKQTKVIMKAKPEMEKIKQDFVPTVAVKIDPQAVPESSTEAVKVKAVNIAPKLILSAPADKTMTKKNVVTVRGRYGAKNSQLQVNNKKTRPDKNGNFTSEAVLKIGKNLIRVSGAEDVSVNVRILCLKSYKDVLDNNLNARLIGYVGALGYLPNTDKFYPETKVLKEDMAIILVKLKGLSLPKLDKAPFRDVPINYPAAPYIKLVTAQELLGVYPDGTFKPKEEITRYQALIILAKLEGLDYENIQVQPNFPFQDVSPNSALAKILQAALDAELISSSPEFNGGAVLTRSALVSLLGKVSLVKKQLAELLDWEKGYYE
ncbi:MAG: S-layer homology domain-containing protein [Candidatus Margulisiibacteriota bacterium]